MIKYYRKRIAFKNQMYVAMIVHDYQSLYYNTDDPGFKLVDLETTDYCDVKKRIATGSHPSFLYFIQTPYYKRPESNDTSFKRIGNLLPPYNEIIWIKSSLTSNILFFACFVTVGNDVGLYPVEIEYETGFANIRMQEKYFTGDRTSYYWSLLK